MKTHRAVGIQCTLGAVSETMGDLEDEGRQGKTFLTVRVACGHFTETLGDIKGKMDFSGQLSSLPGRQALTPQTSVLL